MARRMSRAMNSLLRFMKPRWKSWAVSEFSATRSRTSRGSGYESLHNLKYWRLEPYAGFGADAHSFDGAVREQNTESPSDYVERIESGLPARVDSTPANAAEERFFVGLRLARGIQPMPEEWRRFERPIQRFIADGLLARDGSRLRLTDRGVLFSNEVFAEFITS